jgi:hypothetical protein
LVNYSELGFDQVVTSYDKLHKESGRWQIMQRRVSMDYVTPGTRFRLPTSKVRPPS